jgi:hypothetical protein
MIHTKQHKDCLGQNLISESPEANNKHYNLSKYRHSHLRFRIRAMTVARHRVFFNDALDMKQNDCQSQFSLVRWHLDLIGQKGYNHDL